MCIVKLIGYIKLSVMLPYVKRIISVKKIRD